MRISASILLLTCILVSLAANFSTVEKYRSAESGQVGKHEPIKPYPGPRGPRRAW
jgi:hypothetical protein